MLQFNKILCPIDFSPLSVRTLIYATALTRWSEGELEVLHVAPLLKADSEQVQVTGVVGAAHAGPAPVRVVREQIFRDIGRAMAAAGANDVDARALALEGSAHDVDRLSHSHVAGRSPRHGDAGEAASLGCYSGRSPRKYCGMSHAR